MKKRNLKTLQLKKNRISKLYGGSNYHNAGDVPNDTIHYPPPSEGIEPGCLWYSELYSACDCVTIPHSNCIECPLEHNANGDIRHHHA